MKKLLLVVVTLSLLGIAGHAVNAQVTDTIVADIPFDFTVRNTTLPAGKYTIKSLGPILEGTMEIRNEDSHKAIFFLAESAQAKEGPAHSELIFDRVGNQYFLSEIFETGDRLGAQVAKTRAEKRLEKEGAVIEIHSVTVPAENAVNARN